MEEIKVGEYVKTKYGHIAEVINVNDFRPPESKYGVEANYFNDVFFLGDEDIVKHSFNIKELVQAGDIILYNVNSKMTDIEIVKEHIDARTQEKTLRVGLWSLEQVEIKEILTKEQFNQMKYIVGDE